MSTSYDNFIVQIDAARAEVVAQKALLDSQKAKLTTDRGNITNGVATKTTENTTATVAASATRAVVRTEYLNYKNTNVFAGALLDEIFTRACKATDDLAGKYAAAVVTRFKLHEYRHRLVLLSRREARVNFLLELYSKTITEYDRIKGEMQGHSTDTANAFAIKLSEEVAKSDNTIVTWYLDTKKENGTQLAKLDVDRRVYIRARLKDTFMWPRPTDSMLEYREKNIDELHRIQMEVGKYSGHEYIPQFSYGKFVDGETIKVLPIFTTQKVANEADRDWGMFVRQVPPYINPSDKPAGVTAEVPDENKLLKSSAKFLFTFKYDAKYGGFYMTKYEDLGYHKNDTHEYPPLPYRRILGNCLVSFSGAAYYRSSTALSNQKTGIEEADIAPPYGVDVVYGGQANNPISEMYWDTEFYQRPDPPTDVEATKVGEDQVSVSFTPPARNADGRIPIGYRVIVYPGLSVTDGSRSPVLVRNLAPGKTYQFRVMTNNDRYFSYASVASNPITLEAVKSEESIAITEILGKLSEFKAYRSKKLAEDAK